ncbi:hypothetical protein [Dictyobacter kobayashii]|uniref:Uncharacterized protein n=1 Tax=Dictyobacter kobayashii TaxID=2014872 RepID=A0A402AV85_9CHLR|nr:hypothetical protein [Dictyobacter kobayashii]GCE23028.1 hypothetical protein KDK_68280 [Dictyobacter kobayashii]
MGIYNEEWGLDWRSGLDVEKQQAVIRAYDLLASHDHSRPIIDDSGWNHVKTDVLDWHYYDNDNQRWRDVTAALAGDNTTWFGHQLGVDHWYETQLCVTGHEHQEIPLLNGEYGVGGSSDEERGWYFRWQTQELRRHDAISGYIYTELYDVEYELGGLYNAWRQLKSLGYDPAQVINADTVIIFDLVPYSFGLDYIVEQAELTIPYQISHQGSQSIHGQLRYWWEDDSSGAHQQALDIDPYTITALQTLHFKLPSAQARGRLHVQLLDQHGHCCAYAFLDMASAREAS